MNAAIVELTPIVGVKAACDALNIPRASFYRKRGLGVFPAAAAVRSIPRALDSAERGAVLACLHEERFQNCAPAAVYATLLDEGRYHCSIRTMYRILEGEGEARERRDQLVHPAYQKPELLATGPNQLRSWDITKLLGPAKWTRVRMPVCRHRRGHPGGRVSARCGVTLRRRMPGIVTNAR